MRLNWGVALLMLVLTCALGFATVEGKDLLTSRNAAAESVTSSSALMSVVASTPVPDLNRAAIAASSSDVPQPDTESSPDHSSAPNLTKPPRLRSNPPVSAGKIVGEWYPDDTALNENYAFVEDFRPYKKDGKSCLAALISLSNGRKMALQSTVQYILTRTI